MTESELIDCENSCETKYEHLLSYVSRASYFFQTNATKK